MHPPFVFGHPRSGTSLLTAILDRHSGIAMLPETHLLSALHDTTGPLDHERLLVLAWDRLRTRMGDLQFRPEEVLERFRRHRGTPEGLLRALLELWSERLGKPLAGEKTPAHLNVVDRILGGIPGARAILLIRDGRAVVGAMRRTALHAETPIERLVDGWIHSARLTDQWLAQFPDRSWVVRFEDLVSKPQDTLTPLLHWLGVEFEPSMLQARPTSTFRRWEDFAKRDAPGPIIPEKAEAWREGARLVPPAQVERMAHWLVRFGYHYPDPVSPPQPRLPITAPRRPPPDMGRPPILVIGAHRAGVASLHSWLGMHPEVAPIPARSRAALALDWPLTRAELIGRWGVDVAAAPLESQAWCHAASYYLAHPDLPRRVREVVPDAMVVALLREPVARAYSQWLHAWRMGVELLDFDSAVHAESTRLGDSERRLVADQGAVSFNHIHYSYVRQGRYATNLARWKATITAGQLFVFTLDELIEAPEASWQLLTRHLGLSPSPPPVFPRMESLTWPLTLPAVGQLPAARFIREQLGEEMVRLQDLLGRDLPWPGGASQSRAAGPLR